MIKSTIADIPFRQHPEYVKLTMPNKYRLLVMFHLWLGCDQRQVAFDAHFSEVMQEAVGSEGFDFFLLDAKVRRSFRKIGLVTTRQGYIFAIDLHADEGYPRGIIQDFREGTNLSENGKNLSENGKIRAKNGKIRSGNGKIWTNNGKYNCRNNSVKPPVIEEITPQHDNFINS